MTEYRFARPGEEEAILDHINLVFSQAHQPHHFDRTLAKVYGHDDYAPLHAIALEDGIIRGAIGLLPMELQLDAEHSLHLGFVGSVSVNERYRGRGYMKKLMEMIIARAREQEMDFLALGGQRQRYGYWGFENGGAAVIFEISRANIRHALRDAADDIAVRMIRDENDAALEAIYALCCRQKMICHRRRDRFFQIMHNWTYQLFALERAGKPVGYAFGHPGWIGELGLCNEDDLPAVIKAWMTMTDQMKLTVPAHLQQRARAVKAFAEEYAIRDGEMYRVLNWKRVLKACMEMKHGCMPMANGCLTFEIEGEGRFRLSMQEGKASITETEEAPEKIFTPASAVEFFFSPFSACFADTPLLKDWLPLYIHIPSADAF